MPPGMVWPGYEKYGKGFTSLIDITILWKTGTFYKRGRFLKLPRYSRACQLRGTVSRLLLFVEGTKPLNETEISLLSLSKIKTIFCILTSKHVNQVLINMMQMDFSIISLAFKIQCNLHFDFASLFCFASCTSFLTVFFVIC